MTRSNVLEFRLLTPMQSVLSLTLTMLVGACGKRAPEWSNAAEGVQRESSTARVRYLPIVLTNVPVQEEESVIQEITEAFQGLENVDDRSIAIGITGPMMLSDSVESIQSTIHRGFNYANRFNVPIYFQIDDWHNFVADASPIYGDPLMSEWSSFSEPNQMHGPTPRYWFNWGTWMVTPGIPSLAAPKFREFMAKKMQLGLASALSERYALLKAQGKERLFAGIAIGWETGIPDYGPYQRQTPPSATVNGQILSMERWEMEQIGYASLHWLGYNDAKIAYEAANRGISVSDRVREILYDVCADYTSWMAKFVFDAGIPRDKIYTHIIGMESKRPMKSTWAPPIRVAVNPYSTPGFTLSDIGADYDIANLTSMIHTADPHQDKFASAESYGGGYTQAGQMMTFLNKMFGWNASLVTVFGWTDPPHSSFYFSKDITTAPMSDMRLWMQRGNIYFPASLFQKDGDLYYSNGVDAYCKFTSQAQVERCGFGGSRVTARDEFPDMRNDHICPC